VEVATAFTDVALAAPTFGATRAPTSNVYRAAWGTGAGRVGKTGGGEESITGPSSFTVTEGGQVALFDGHNRRVVLAGGGPTRLVQLPETTFPFGDILATDRDIYVSEARGLEHLGAVSRFDRAGRLQDRVAAPNGAVQLAQSPSGVAIQSEGAWRAVTEDGSRALVDVTSPAALGNAGAVDAELPDIVTSFTNEDMLVARRDDAGGLRAWRVRTSGSLFGGLSLAVPLDDGVLVVVGIWNEDHGENLVLRLGPEGLRESFTVDYAQWAESLPDGRFDIGPAGLYQLRTDSKGAEVVTYKIGGKP
ncbi:MAG: hypothetical protein SGJ13_02265, partial [Actinomycetota bacterium]|nr:hypothetical protein [Actinomycetota bacterium]